MKTLEELKDEMFENESDRTREQELEREELFDDMRAPKLLERFYQSKQKK